MREQTMHWKERFKLWLPSRESLATHPWLGSVAVRLTEPGLWHMQHEAVARGVAIGTFWAFVLPFGQIVAAAAHCVWWRANIPAAAAMTLLTNPLTIGFWLWLAYQVGAGILGGPSAPGTTQDLHSLQWLAEIGWPTLLGMALFAPGGATLGYFGVKGVWRIRVWRKCRARRLIR